MQSITVAISCTGIDFFIRSIYSGTVQPSLKTLKPADHTVTVDPFTVKTGAFTKAAYSSISISLTGGNIIDFSPAYQNIQQLPEGVFQLSLLATAFTADYAWNETYIQQNQKYEQDSPRFPGHWVNDGNPFPVAPAAYAYSAGIGSLAVTINFSFTFDPANNAWTLPISNVTATPSNPSPNIPASSILQGQVSQPCTQSHVSAATVTSIDNIDFASAIKAINNYLISIPASGNLTPEIIFDFGLGDSGLAFPNDSNNKPTGIQIEATGTSTYTDPATGTVTAYSGKLSADLPVPDVPEGYHLQMYVSDYVLNGLYWAFFKDGKLAATVNPSDLYDPNILKVRTWDSEIRQLQRYAALDMQVQLQPVQAPTVEFQEVYLFTQEVMDNLNQQMPTIASLITGMLGNYYPNKTDLEQDLTDIYAVDNQYFAQLEQIAQTPGAAVFHDIQFTVTIQGAAPINGNAPFLEFTVSRTDVLENLALGIANNAQTLQFGFFPGTNSVLVTFNQSNFLDKSVIGDFGTQIWPHACEPVYDKLLSEMGLTGVPLPIMQGFQFLFDKAVLSIRPQDFIAILSDVEFKG